MDLTISFLGRMLTTLVYIKVDFQESLLLSEGVCNQLDIIQYHLDVKERQRAASVTSTEGPNKPRDRPNDHSEIGAVFATIPPGHCAVVQIAVEGAPQDALKMLEPDPSVYDELGLQLSDAVLQMSGVGKAQLVIANNSGFTKRVPSSQVFS